MKQQVLKALATPARIFYVPYSIAVINFLVQFILFIFIFIISLVFTGKDINPLYFLCSVFIVHMLIASVSKYEPQLGQIISAKIDLLKHKVPKRLVV